MNAHHLSIPQNRQKVNTPLPKAKPSTSSAFTIVELLIVVVVIAILAAITIISYNGISNRAKLSSLKNRTVSIFKETRNRESHLRYRYLPRLYQRRWYYPTKQHNLYLPIHWLYLLS